MNSSYHIVRIQRYLNGELSNDEMYELEREALNDPLLQDAIDGYRLQQDVSHRQLSLLQQRLADRIEGKAKERNAFFFGWQRLGVAATACVLMVLVLVLLWMRNQSIQQRAAEKEVHVELTPTEAPVRIQATAATAAAVDAYPEGGWDAFNTYLGNAFADVEATSGKTMLTFDVDTQGVPTNIQVLGDVDSRLLDEFHRLLEAGPRWQGSKAQVEIAWE